MLNRWWFGLIDVAFLVVLSVSLAVAQQTGRHITLSEAIDIALVHSPLLKMAEHQVESAAAGVVHARAGWFPRLDFTESFTRSNNPVFAFGAKLNQGEFTQDDFNVDRLNDPGAANDFVTRLSLAQPLFQGGKVRNDVQQARLQQQAREQERHRHEQEVIFEVARAYYGILRTQAELEVVRAAIRAAEANRDLARDRFETGLAVESDVLSAQVRLAGLREQEITATHQVLLAQATLNDVMGVSLGEPFTVVDRLTERPSRYDITQGLEELALERRPDYQKLSVDEQRLMHSIGSARSAYFPRLGLTADYELHRPEFVSGGQDSWFVGVALQWNLFNGLADRAKVNEARANLAYMQALRARVASGIKLEVKQAALQLQAAGERIKVASGAIAQAQESLRIIRNRYEAGITTITDLLAGEEALTRAQGNHTRALYDYNVGLARLELALGSIDQDAF